MKIPDVPLAIFIDDPVAAEAWSEGYAAGYRQACKDVKTEQMPLFESRETVRAKYGCTKNPCRFHG